MGLSIAYRFRCDCDAAEALHLLERLRAFAQQSPAFDHVHEIHERTFRQGRRPNRRRDPAGHWIHAQGSRCHKLKMRDETKSWVLIPPLHSMFFLVRTEGAESAALGLATYPARHARRFDREQYYIETGLGDAYSWSASCKTQYASAERHGGPENFLRAHLGLIELLDFAQSIGLRLKVWDDSEYWQKRDETELLDKLKHSNELIAAFVGMFKDAFGKRSDGLVVAPITEHQDFEHLEARGLRLWREQRRTANG